MLGFCFLCVSLLGQLLKVRLIWVESTMRKGAGQMVLRYGSHCTNYSTTLFNGSIVFGEVWVTGVLEGIKTSIRSMVVVCCCWLWFCYCVVGRGFCIPSGVGFTV